MTSDYTLVTRLPHVCQLENPLKELKSLGKGICLSLSAGAKQGGFCGGLPGRESVEACEFVKLTCKIQENVRG